MWEPRLRFWAFATVLWPPESTGEEVPEQPGRGQGAKLLVTFFALFGAKYNNKPPPRLFEPSPTLPILSFLSFCFGVLRTINKYVKNWMDYPTRRRRSNEPRESCDAWSQKPKGVGVDGGVRRSVGSSWFRMGIFDDFAPGSGFCASARPTAVYRNVSPPSEENDDHVEFWVKPKLKLWGRSVVLFHLSPQPQIMRLSGYYLMITGPKPSNKPFSWSKLLREGRRSGCVKSLIDFLIECVGCRHNSLACNVKRLLMHCGQKERERIGVWLKVCDGLEFNHLATRSGCL